MGRASRFDKPICWRAGSRSSLGWILTLVLALVGLAGQHEAFGATTPIRVSDVNHSSQNQQIAAKGRFVYVVWQDNDVGIGDIFFARSLDKGATFPATEMLNLSDSSGNSYTPKVAAAGPYVFVAWRETIPYVGNRVFLTYSTDHGRHFSLPDDISGCTYGTNVSWGSIRLEASGNTAHVIWSQKAPCSQNDSVTPGDYVHYRYVTVTNQGPPTLGGVRFPDSRGGVNAQLAVSGNSVYLTWAYTYIPPSGPQSNRIYFASSRDNGRNFDNAFPFPFPHAGGSRIVASGNNVYVYWPESTGVRLAASSNQGDNLNDPGFTPTNLMANLTLDWVNNPIAASGNNLYLIGKLPSSRDLLFFKSTDGGANFGSQPIIINPNFSSSDKSTIAASGQNVYVVYSMSQGTTDPGAREIYYRHSSDSGGNFGVEQNLSNSPSVESRHMKIATYGDNAYVTWREDRTDLGSGINHIMVVRPTDAVAEPTWLPPEPPSQLRLTP